jgi:ribosomal protein L3 glutamine methyltransferase
MRSAERGTSTRQTLRTLLRESARRLATARISFGHGTTNARDESAWLVAHALHLPFEALEAQLDRPLKPAEMRRVGALIAKRIRTRKPAAYLLREAWLGNDRFYVDERVIVPRSYIAELMRENLAPWIMHVSQVRRALDLCTGSGCLAILLARAFADAQVDGSDVSRAALEVAKRNVLEYRLGRRVKLIASDLFASIGTRRYDLIVSNPPYVRDATMRKLPKEYLREPALALAGGRDGLDFVRRIVADAAHYLKPRGVLIVETGHRQQAVERAFPGLRLSWPLTSGGDDCVFVITREQLLAASPAA